MSALPARAKLHLATLSDLGRIYTDAEWAIFDLRPDVHAGLPPPGMELVRNPVELPNEDPTPLPYIWGEVVGSQEHLVPGDLYWTTFAQYVVGLSSETATKLLSRLLNALAFLPGTWNDPLTYPIVFEVGQGDFVRWLKVTLSGTLGSVEQFQHGFQLGKPGADPDITMAEQLELAETIAGIWQAQCAIATGTRRRLDSLFGSQVKYVEVGVAQLEKTGADTTQEDSTQWFAYPLGTWATGSGTTLPFEVACAVTLQTTIRGPRGRGRTYLPPFDTSAMTTSGVFTTEAVGSAAETVLGTFQDIIDDTPYEPIVVSRAHQVLNRIDHVLVGQVPDSQRRRRRSQLEAPQDAGALVYD